MAAIASDRQAERFRALFDDRDAFRTWYDAALPVVYSFVLARCRDSTVAAEITQDSFVDGVRQRARFDGASDPVTWICGIAKHKVADHFRQLVRERRRHLKLQRERPPETQTSDQTEAHVAVEAALRPLPPAQQVVLVMHYLDDVPVREIASTLGRSESSIESLLSRGREGFRRTYGSASGGSHER